jgi:hypothetical protein
MHRNFFAVIVNEFRWVQALRGGSCDQSRAYARAGVQPQCFDGRQLIPGAPTTINPDLHQQAWRSGRQKDRTLLD